MDTIQMLYIVGLIEGRYQVINVKTKAVVSTWKRRNDAVDACYRLNTWNGV